MTDTQFKEKVEELAKRVEELINDRADFLLKSGAVNLEAWDDNFRLPKLFICAMASEIYDQFSPPNIDRKEKKEIKNIELFL